MFTFTNQQNEDRYGNEIKRRRMDDAGKHLKVWRVCEFKYALQVPAFNEEDFLCQEEVNQEEVNQEEEVAEVTERFAALAIMSENVAIMSENEDAVPLPIEDAVPIEDALPIQVLGRRVIIYTIQNNTVHGIIQTLFDLNGERSIQIQTSDGDNLIFSSSQIVGLEVFLNPNEEQLSPIAPPIAHEVILIDDASEADDDNDASTQAPDQDQDDFPEVEFQPSRRSRQPEEEEEEEEERDCCAICLDLTDAARNFVSLDCGHQFHFACIMGNMANGGPNRNQCPMCRGAVVQQYDVHSQETMDEMVERLARNNQRLQDELDLNRQHREDLTEEYVRVMTMNMQINARHREEREARDALERRAQICFLNERIGQVVLNAANNDIRRNYGGARVHVERQIRDLCMSFGMMAYDAQYDPEDQGQNHEIIEVD
jgi:hypothetical protein